MPKRIIIGKDILEELYINQGKTMKEICEITGIKSPITIAKKMDEYGIQRRDPNKENSLINRLGLTQEQFKKELTRLYIDEEKSAYDIARIYDVTHTIIFRRLKEYGIPMRSHAEANRVSHGGEKSRNWNGGKRTHSDGYIQIRMKDHPNADGCGYVYEHRYVMEQHLGRYLRSDEHVHHINENKKDNRIENLQILTNSEHAKLHAKKRKQGILRRRQAFCGNNSGNISGNIYAK